MRRIAIALPFLLAFLAACGPPPCPPSECGDATAEAEYDRLQAEEALENYRIDQDVERLNEYLEEQAEYYDQFDGP